MGKEYDNKEFKSYSEKYQYMKKSNYCKELIEAEQAKDRLENVLKIVKIAIKIALPILLMCLVMTIITLFVGLFH